MKIKLMLKLYLFAALVFQGHAFAKEGVRSHCELSQTDCLNQSLAQMKELVQQEYGRLLMSSPAKKRRSSESTIFKADIVALHQAWLRYQSHYCSVYSGTMGLLPQTRDGVMKQCQIEQSELYFQFLLGVHP